MTIDRTQTDELNAFRTHRDRVRYAIDRVGKPSEDITTADVRSWLDDRGVKLHRSQVSTYLNEWKRENDIPIRGATAEQPRLTPELLADLDTARAEDFGPRDDSPISPATTSRPVASPILPPVASPPRAVTPPRDVPAPRHDRDVVADDAPLTRHISDAPADRDNSDAPADRDNSDAAEAPEVTVPWSFRCLYGGLLIGAGFGLYEVLHHVAGAPVIVAAVAAAAIELVGISVKRLADRGERHGEPRRVVRSLLITSGVIAVGIAITNGVGHAQIPMDNGTPVIAAAGYAMMSILGYVIWTVSTALAHRATQRRRGRLEGPGVRVPAYVRERYGKAVVERAELVSQIDESLTIDGAVKRAIDELDAEEREERDRERRADLRAGLIAQSKERHPNNPLAAKLDASQYSGDVLADLMTADEAGHIAKRDELREWMNSYKI